MLLPKLLSSCTTGLLKPFESILQKSVFIRFRLESYAPSKLLFLLEVAGNVSYPRADVSPSAFIYDQPKSLAHCILVEATIH
jgi:hypothetical protein